MNQPVYRTGQPATEEEAAAIAAAVKRFTVDTTVAPPAADEGPPPWLKAALIEGVSAKAPFSPGNPDDPG